METKNDLKGLSSFKEQAQQMTENSKNKTPDEILSIFNEERQELALSEIGKNAKQPGSMAPQFVLPNASSKPVSLKESLTYGNVVLTFYRGAWCPYCNLLLKMYQDILPQIKSLGASLIAVSPMTPDNSLSMKEKQSLQFEVLSDNENTIARQYGVVYNVNKKVIDFTLKSGLNTPAVYNGTDKWELPLASTFIINRKGVIISTFVGKDYAEGMEPQKILDILKQDSII
jgi:peroxiredoxin